LGDHTAARAGRAELGEDTVPVNQVELDVLLKPGESREWDEVVLDVAKRIGQVPGLGFAVEGFLGERIHEILSGQTAPVVVTVTGPDLGRLRVVASDVARIMERTSGLGSVQPEPQIDVPQLSIHPDEAAMTAPTFQNLGFEIAGSGPGLATGWTLGFGATAEEIAGYSPAPERPQEDFERAWSDNEHFLFRLPRTSLEPAFYDEAPESVEDFEENWRQNETFLTDLGSVVAADYDPGAATKLFEDFDTLWAGNSSFLYAFAPANLSSGPLDGFETGWRSNQTFLFVFGGSDLSVGPTETFEAAWTAMKTV
jgi:hypothetical protein